MISAEEYLKSLDEKSVWVFTKQQTSNLEQIINATNMYAIFYGCSNELIMKLKAKNKNIKEEVFEN